MSLAKLTTRFDDQAQSEMFIRCFIYWQQTYKFNCSNLNLIDCQCVNYNFLAETYSKQIKYERSFIIFWLINIFNLPVELKLNVRPQMHIENLLKIDENSAKKSNVTAIDRYVISKDGALPKKTKENFQEKSPRA